MKFSDNRRIKKKKKVLEKTDKIEKKSEKNQKIIVGNITGNTISYYRQIDGQIDTQIDRRVRVW